MSEKTELEIAKQTLKKSKDPAEREKAQQKYDALLEKDISSDKAVISACSNGQAASAACAGERLKAIAAKGGYETGNYNNQASDMYPDAYGQIVNLLNITSIDAQNQQQVKDAMVNYAMTQFGVDKATAESYVETYDGMKTVAASMTPLLGGAAVSKIDSIVANYSKKTNQLSTETVFDSIKATMPVHPGTVIPQSFEMSLPNGQKIWVHGNATEHMAEYVASKAVIIKLLHWFIKRINILQILWNYFTLLLYCCLFFTIALLGVGLVISLFFSKMRCFYFQSIK
ncbi:hypothetical protein KYK12_023430 (plasmid) [Escherichia coli]|nr:hypothetical protein [Escherichia coli]WNH00174.1 hypothetical protein KYK12_023430 [Escherichia coli]